MGNIRVYCTVYGHEILEAHSEKQFLHRGYIVHSYNGATLPSLKALLSALQVMISKYGLLCIVLFFFCRASNMWPCCQLPATVWSLGSPKVWETQRCLCWWRAVAAKCRTHTGVFVQQLWVHGEHKAWISLCGTWSRGRLQEVVTRTWGVWVVWSFLQLICFARRRGMYCRMIWSYITLCMPINAKEGKNMFIIFLIDG